MDVNATNIAAVFKAIVTGFQSGMDMKPPIDLSFMVSDFPSATAENFYPWLENIPGFIEWLGDRQFQNLKSQGFTVPNRDFELSLSMPQKAIEDDQYGIYGPMLQMAASRWPVLLYELVVEMITNQRKAWDGKLAAATDHAYGANTIANLVTGALTTTTFDTAFTTAAGWKFSNGKPCRTRWTHLLHGPKLETTVFNLILNRYVNDGTAATSVQIDNPRYNKVTPVMIPDLVGTYDDYWALVDCTGAIKPCLRQVRKTPRVLTTTDPVEIAKQGRMDIVADGRAATAPTFFHLFYLGAVA
jgi:phage major head subunit gpT-like protein